MKFLENIAAGFRALTGRTRVERELDEELSGFIDASTEAKRRAGMLLEVARLFEAEVGDLGKSFTALLAAYKEDPRPHTWDELERLASATGTWAELLAELT